MRYSVFVLLLLGGLGNNSYAQCCAQGTAMGGAGNMGVLGRNEFQFVSFYRWSESVSQKTPNPYNITGADFNFVGTALSYGITNRLTAEAEVGYFINKSQHYTIGTTDYLVRGFGFSNGYFTLKYGFKLGQSGTWDFVAGMGFKFPFTTDYQIVDGVQIPLDNQPSTCAFGVAPKILIFKKFKEQSLNLFLQHRTDINFPNQYDYTYGHSFTTSLFAAKNLNFISCNLLGVLQVRHDYRMMDKLSTGADVTTTGSNTIFVAPQIGYTFFKKIFISAAYDFPVYQHFNTEKLKYKHALTFSLVLNPACFKKSAPEESK